MKFLCVPCDTPMTLQTLAPPERGSLSIVYACPACGYEMAMLTNAYETQLVQSLGVRVGPGDRTAAAAGARADMPGEATPAERAEAAGCPFAAMLPPSEASAATPSAGSANDSFPIQWTTSAEARLGNIPEFVRPMARMGIERFARERGAAEVDERILDAARDFFGM
jgi:hypothetical protein